jgi:hypothetical protein
MEGYYKLAKRLMQKPRKDEDVELLTQDVYRKRPFDWHQRQHGGTLPVLADHPHISVDEISAELPSLSLTASSHPLGCHAFKYGTGFFRIAFKCFFLQAGKWLSCGPQDSRSEKPAFSCADPKDPLVTGEELPGPYDRSSTGYFVTDAECREPAYAGVADDPYGGGRHLLLPLFRSLQRRAARLLALCHTAGGGRGFGHAQMLRLSGSAAGADSTRRTYPSICRPNGSGELPSSGQAVEMQPVSASTSSMGMQQGQEPSAKVQIGAEEPADATASAASGAEEVVETDQGIQRYTVTGAEAVAAARRQRRMWEIERSQLLAREEGDAGADAFPPSTEEDADDTFDGTTMQLSCSRVSSPRTDNLFAENGHPVAPAEPASHGEALAAWPAADSDIDPFWAPGVDTSVDYAGVLRVAASLGCNVRRIKPGVYAMTEDEEPPTLDEALQKLSAMEREGDADAQKVANMLWEHQYFIEGERDPPNPVMGEPPEVKLQAAYARARAEKEAASGKKPPSANAWSPADEREAAALHDAVQRLRESHNMGVSLGRRLREGWERCSLQSSAADGQQMQRVRAARLLHEAHGRARIVADGQSVFASAEGRRKTKVHNFRLLVLSHRKSRLCNALEAQAAAAAAAKPAAMEQSADAEEKVQAGTSPDAISSAVDASAVQTDGGAQRMADAARRLGVRHGAGSSYFPPADALLPEIPDLIRLIGCDTSAQDGQPPDSAAADGEHQPSAHKGGSAQQRSVGQEGTPAQPEKPPLGLAWRTGLYMTIPMTTMYEFNPETGQVGA